MSSPQTPFLLPAAQMFDASGKQNVARRVQRWNLIDEKSLAERHDLYPVRNGTADNRLEAEMLKIAACPSGETHEIGRKAFETVPEVQPGHQYPHRRIANLPCRTLVESMTQFIGEDWNQQWRAILGGAQPEP